MLNNLFHISRYLSFFLTKKTGMTVIKSFEKTKFCLRTESLFCLHTCDPEKIFIYKTNIYHIEGFVN